MVGDLEGKETRGLTQIRDSRLVRIAPIWARLRVPAASGGSSGPSREHRNDEGSAQPLPSRASASDQDGHCGRITDLVRSCQEVAAQSIPQSVERGDERLSTDRMRSSYRSETGRWA